MIINTKKSIFGMNFLTKNIKILGFLFHKLIEKQINYLKKIEN